MVELRIELRRGLDVRIDDDQVLGVSENLGRAAVDFECPAKGRDDLFPVAAELPGPNADPDDVWMKGPDELVEALVLDRLANAHVDSSALPLEHSGDQGVELLPVRAVQRGARLLSVVERDLSGPLESPVLGEANQRSLLRTSGERAMDDRVLLRAEDQRQGGCPVAQIGARDLAGLDRLPRAIEDVIDDLEDDAEIRAELAQRIAAAEHAGSFEQLCRLQRAAFEIGVDG